MQRTFDAFGVLLSISSECDGVDAALERFLPVFPRAKRTPAVTYVLAKRGGAYALVKGRRTLRITPDFAAVVAVLVQDVQATLARLARGRTLVHAGVVGIGDSALILPGRPGAGKSTLVAALLRAGAAYASDEFAVLDADGRVWPYPRWLVLRAADGEQRFPASALTTRIVDRPLPVGTILFTEYRSGSRFQPRSLSPAACVLQLLSHCTGARARPAETLAALRAATAGATALETARGDAEETARILLAGGTRVQFAAESR